MPEQKIAPEDTPIGQDCPDGYHRNPKTNRCERIRAGAQTTDTSSAQTGNATAPEKEPGRKRTQSERNKVAPKEGVKPKAEQAPKKPSGSTSARIIQEYAGDAVKYFQEQAKKRYKTGIQCPFAEQRACYFWGIPNKVFITTYAQIGNLYSKAQQIKDAKQREATESGYDSALDFYDEINPPDDNKAYDMAHMQDVHNKLVARGNEIKGKYGVERLNHPRNNKERQARAEYQAYVSIINSNAQETKKLKSDAQTQTTSTSSQQQGGKPAKPAPPKNIRLPNGMVVSSADIRRIRNM